MFSSVHEAMEVKWALKNRDKQTLLLLGFSARPNEDREGKCSKVLCQSPVRNRGPETSRAPPAHGPAEPQTVLSHHLKPEYLLDYGLQIQGWVSLSIGKVLLGGALAVRPEKEVRRGWNAVAKEVTRAWREC